MPGAGNRYVVCRISSWGEKRCWAVEDLSIQRDNLLRDWRARGTRKPVWRGTFDQATELCASLNLASQQSDIEIEPVGDMTGSMAGFYSRLGKRTAGKSTNRGATAVRPTFSKCEKCGANYKGEHAC